jgi:dsDNA-binding SOS-regulon protein
LIDSIQYLLNLDLDLSTVLDKYDHLLCEEDEADACLPPAASKAKKPKEEERAIQIQKMKKEMLGILKKHGLKCDDTSKLEKFTINLASIMSQLTDCICSETKAGYM